LSRSLPHLSSDACLEAARGFERLIAWLQSKQAEALAQAARLAPAMWRNPDHDRTQEQVENVLAVSANGAGARMVVARYLDEHLLAKHMLERGEITLSHVRVFIDELANCSDEVTAAVEAAVLPTAPGRTSAAPACKNGDPVAVEDGSGVSRRPVRFAGSGNRAPSREPEPSQEPGKPPDAAA
jgi:hypothetical protein